MKNDVINMSRQRKIWVINRTRTYDLPYNWAGRMSYMNLEYNYGPARHESFVAVRASDQCTEGHRFNSCGGLRFFFVPCSRHVDHIIFHFFTELKSTAQKLSWHSKLKTRSSCLEAQMLRVSRCKNRVSKCEDWVLSFDDWGSRIQEDRFSKRTMLYSHVAVEIFAPSISACGAVFCNCLNCQGLASFQ